MRRYLPAIIIVALGSCSGPAPRIVPAAAPPPVYVPPPPPPPAPALGSDWRDWPLTPGDWRYAPTGGGSAATFGSGVFGIACDRGTRRVSLLGGPSAATMVIRTTSTTRSIAVQQSGDARDVAVLSANDPLLDAMAFSRGRFIVEQAGQPPLVLPAYAEVGRVIEDCRG
ncbi:MAG: hypothetical protein M3R41_04570 [Pseudomonadota bacterium]|nr:hypothetical protein [Pseudomonadota bacterium]